MTDIYPERRWQVPLSRHYPAKTTPKSPIKKFIAKSAFNPPNHEIQSFARCILPAIQAYFESEKGKKEYVEWCKKRQVENDKTA